MNLDKLLLQVYAVRASHDLSHQGDILIHPDGDLPQFLKKYRGNTKCLLDTLDHEEPFSIWRVCTDDLYVFLAQEG